MKMNLSRLFETTGAEAAIQESFLFPPEEALPFSSVEVKGMVQNLAGVVSLHYTVAFSLCENCDRCLEPFMRDMQYSFEHVLVASLEDDEDDFLLVEDMELDVDELVRSDIILQLPAKMLCSEDCKGLCPRCGKNWNHGSCDCKEPKGDPRFRVLDQLLT